MRACRARDIDEASAEAAAAEWLPRLQSRFGGEVQRPPPGPQPHALLAFIWQSELCQQDIMPSCPLFPMLPCQRELPAFLVSLDFPNGM